MDWTYWIWLGAAYLSGSVPYALLIGKAKGVDIREHGSGNVGATNCGRTLGKKYGILCFLCDVLKGLLPVLLYGVTHDGALGSAGGAGLWVAIAAASVLGHVFPVWLGFKGGKGVATSLGVLLGVWPVLTVAGLVAAGIWYGLVKKTGYVSIGSVGAAVSMPVLAGLVGLAFGVDLGALAVLVAVAAALGGLVVFRHRSNLANLKAGTESKAGWAVKRS